FLGIDAVRTDDAAGAALDPAADVHAAQRRAVGSGHPAVLVGHHGTLLVERQVRYRFTAVADRAQHEGGVIAAGAVGGAGVEHTVHVDQLVVRVLEPFDVAGSEYRGGRGQVFEHDPLVALGGRFPGVFLNQRVLQPQRGFDFGIVEHRL